MDTKDAEERKAILTSIKENKDLGPILATMNVFDFPLNLRDLSEKATALLWKRKFDWSRSTRLPRALVHAETLLENKADLLLASPLTHARHPQIIGDLPSFMLLHGARYPLIPAGGCLRVASELRDHGADVVVSIDPNKGHWHGEAFSLVPQFFKRTL